MQLDPWTIHLAGNRPPLHLIGAHSPMSKPMQGVLMSYHPLPGRMLVLAGVLAGCKSERPAEKMASAPAPAAPAAASAAATSPATVTITATDFKLDLPSQIPAGAVTLHLINHGKELHQAQIIRLEDGKTVADFAKAMQKNGPPPSWAKWVG